MKYGTRLATARKLARLTQAGLAAKIDHACTQENISKLERGNATGSEFTTLFARACGVSHIWLATGEGQMAPAAKTGKIDGAAVAEKLISPKDAAILDLFHGLTEAQQKEFFRELEEKKRQNDTVIAELTHKRRKAI